MSKPTVLEFTITDTLKLASLLKMCKQLIDPKQVMEKAWINDMEKKFESSVKQHPLEEVEAAVKSLKK